MLLEPYDPQQDDLVKSALTNRNLRDYSNVQIEPAMILPAIPGVINQSYIGLIEGSPVFVKSYSKNFSLERVVIEIDACEYFRSIGISAPDVLGFQINRDTMSLLFTYIGDDQFCVAGDIDAIDHFFLYEYELKRRTVPSKSFGFLSPQTSSGDYPSYANSAFNKYLTKHQSDALGESVSLALAQYPCNFYSSQEYHLSHGDIALRHFYKSGNGIGLVDLELAKFVDPEFDIAVWLVHSYSNRTERQINHLIKQYLDLYRPDLGRLTFHIIKEAFLYEHFYKDYNFASKVSHLMFCLERLYPGVYLEN